MNNQENQGPLDRFSSWVSRSVTIRILTIGFLVLLLLIPVSQIESLIHERESYRQFAIEEVSAKWGNQQTLTGPVLAIPYLVWHQDQEKKTVSTKSWAYFLPESLDVKAHLEPEIRYRGIYEVPVYVAKVDLRGGFQPPDFTTLGIPSQDILWSEANLQMSISDLRGLQNQPQLSWGDQTYEFQAGLPAGASSGPGIHIPLDLSGEKSEHVFEGKFELRGSQGFFVSPVAKNSKVHIHSTWQTPSFTGAFLPKERKVGKEGFEAGWEVLHLNRSFPQEWIGSSTDLHSADFGVNLLLPVDQYQKTLRSVKYAVLLISLTFLVFFFVETRYRRRIHPIQYLLVGLALCIFYALELSLSEHIGFDLAFIISAMAVVLLVAAYLRSVFNHTGLTLFQSALLVLMYGFNYVLLQLEDYALVAGVVGLFVILAGVMLATRQYDWYDLAESKSPSEKD